MTTYPEGTRVRCTLGPNVIEGVVSECDDLLIEGTGQHAFSPLRPPWAVEVLAPPRPDWADRVGTIVLDKNGNAWRRGFTRWWIAVSEPEGATYDALVKSFGPLTLLHDPEANS